MHYGKKVYPKLPPKPRGPKQTAPDPEIKPRKLARNKMAEHLFDNKKPQHCTLNQDGLDAVETYIRTGIKVEQIYHKLGISRGQWQAMKVRQPQIQETLDRARKGAFRTKLNPSQHGLCVIDPDTLAPVGITPAGLEVVEKVFSSACGKRTAASALGLTQQAYKDLREKCPELQKAEDRGYAKLDEINSENLMKQAKHNTIAAIWIDKSRLGRSENDAPQRPASNVTIVLPDSLTPEQWRQKALAENVPVTTTGESSE